MVVIGSVVPVCVAVSVVATVVSIVAANDVVVVRISSVDP